jgi:predicted kinase
MSSLIHINGWPGCGKLTIARLVAKQLNARLIDNHTLINPADALFGRDDPSYWPMRRAVRTLVFEYAAKLPSELPLVCTNALADIESDRAYFDEYRALASARGARLIAVTLECDLEENVRRLTASGRADLLKLTNPEILRDARRSYGLYRPDDPLRIVLDVTRLTAEEAAAALSQLLSMNEQRHPTFSR